MTDAGPSWTKERVELLKRLWIDGRSASQIAAEIGGVSRNAVIGKIHRLGLANRVLKGNVAPPPAARRVRSDADSLVGSVANTPSMLAPPPPALALVPSQPSPRSASVALPESARVTIMELRDFMCRWPMGDPATPDFSFCGDRAIAGLPYCTEHSRLAYQPPAERKRDRKIVGFR